MANEHTQNRRPHYHRGRRGADRRGVERRSAAQNDQGARGQVDVEQIMREIRARIAKRHGIDLTPQQIHELAARRLDAILDPRNLKPSLLEQMRRAAGEPIEVPPLAPVTSEPELEESAIYASHRSIVRVLRRWLNPILKLFFNPRPLVDAIRALTRRADAAAAREAELYARQAEWNALHYEIIQRLVTEAARTSLELQDLTLRVESLSAKVDFNERRVRSLEAPAQPTRQARPAPPTEAPAEAGRIAAGVEGAQPGVASDSAAEGTKRRRRRRRGRRGGGVPMAESDAAGETAQLGPGSEIEEEPDTEEIDEGPGDEGESRAAEPVTAPAAEPSEPIAASHGQTSLEPAHTFSMLQPVERQPPEPLPEEPAEAAPSSQPPQEAADAPAPPDREREATSESAAQAAPEAPAPADEPAPPVERPDDGPPDR